MVSGQMVRIAECKELVKSTIDAVDSLEKANAGTKYQVQLGFALPGYIGDMDVNQLKTILNKFKQALENFSDGIPVHLSLSVLEDSPITRELLEKAKKSYETKQTLKEGVSQAQSIQAKENLQAIKESSG